ncbi:MAG: hypothetical protein MUP76_08575 [Acidimicrobiia bacterium]|nr:hypothetical protein [Acidimicrobiia bacterium]
MTGRSRLIPLAAAIGLVAVLLAACGDDGSVLGVPATSSTTSEATSSSAAPASTEAPGTTATVPPSTSTTTTAPAPTTTTTAPPATLGPPPVAFEFLPTGLGIIDFGATPAATITAVKNYLGSNSTFDSGWGPAWGDYGACPGTEYRQVEFQGLTLQFSDVDRFQPAGTRQFIGWWYNGTPAGIAPFGVDIGMTVADLQALYPTAILGYDDMWFFDNFRVDGAVFGEQLWGTLSGPNPTDTIESLAGGIGCGE